MRRRTLTDLIYTRGQQRRLASCLVGRAVLDFVAGAGNLLYIDILLERREVVAQWLMQR